MGLDNGIRIVCKKEQLTGCPFYDTLEECWDYSVEIAYWRKCWSLRGEILEAIEANDADYSFHLSANDVNNIIDILSKHISKKYWDDSCDSIWEYEEYVYHNCEIIIKLKWLRDFLTNHPDIECYFYDSY